jgi:TetR/AcrR family transcriptional regulator
MRAIANSRTASPPEWELKSLGRRLPRSLRHARDFTTAQRIVAAAASMFAEQGLAGARMDEIARAAKVNKALLYYYFRSKEELHRFVLETLLSQLRTRVWDLHTAKLPARKRLAAAIDNFFEFVRRHPNYPRLIQREMMSDGRNVEWIVSEYYKPLHARLVALIEDGISSGEFRRVDARNTALTVVSSMVFYFAAAPVLKRILGHDPLRPQEVARRRQAIQDLLEHGLLLPGAGTP